MQQNKAIAEATPAASSDASASTDPDRSDGGGVTVPWTSFGSTSSDDETNSTTDPDDSAATTGPDDETNSTTGPDDEPAADDADAAAETDAPLPLDQVFGILKNQRRRRVLRMLQEADGTTTLSDLAEQIAAWENDKEVKQITSSERKRVYVGLYQCHLPKMDDMGVIDFNKPRGTVVLGDNMEVMYNYLETATADTEPDWHYYSMFLSMGGAVALGTALLATPMTTLPVLDVAVTGLLVAFLGYGIVCLRWGQTHD
ncbi:DUF7344 domain-containing protein [Halonotius roseus]|jgi:hypothetical protein|uniref:DUF7344 domain-containing protein n=1 Tax=Halonotius roseus TaxID=2511997 RepID=A0A544QMY2_9EURY|nr:hypothetical protein [Halonotius roseus]TQQ80240.1 hypothetical protein EWF95_07015 [Halonotius roseus]